MDGLVSYGMPKGPKGQKRPADINQLAKAIIEASTEGEKAESPQRKGGLAGGKSRANKLSPAERIEISKKAAKGRWSKKK